MCPLLPHTLPIHAAQLSLYGLYRWYTGPDVDNKRGSRRFHHRPSGCCWQKRSCVRPRFHMGRIYKHYALLHQSRIKTLRQYPLKYLFKQVCILEPSCVVLTKGREVGDFVYKLTPGIAGRSSCFDRLFAGSAAVSCLDGQTGSAHGQGP